MLEENFEIILYLAMFVACIFWSSMALRRPIDQPDTGTIVFDFLSTVFWIVFSAVHVLSSVGSSFLTLAYVFMSLGFAFLVLGVAHSIMSWNIRQKAGEWELG